MRFRLPLLLLIVAAPPANAATRNFGVSGFDRIRVEGPFKVRVTTGIPPMARSSGTAQSLDALSVETQGRTLVIKTGSRWGGYPGASAGPVEIEIGTHELSSATIAGSGSLAISQVKGLTFDLALHGSGVASIASADVDQFKLSQSGSGLVSLAGSALRLTAVVRGVSSLDGRALNVKDATIGAEGPATVRLSVSETAKVEARGAATVELAGTPVCNSKTEGSATVSGCR